MANILPYESIKRTVLTRKTEETNPSWGCYPKKRPVPELIRNGVINLDKPSGPTSHQVSAWVKEILGAAKVGHGGTLDPAVTGVLPTAVDNATKIIKTFLYSGKEYVALMHLHGDVHEGKLRDALKEYTGNITQLPPLRSHVKRVERTREIYYIEFLEKNGRDVLFKVGCQAGTYIRRLCEQIGKLLKIGAHMTELRRTKAGGFSENERLVTLQDVADAYAYYKEEGNEKFLRYCIQPVEDAIKHVPKVWSLMQQLNHCAREQNLLCLGYQKLKQESKIVILLQL